ncbi:Tn3 family transposase [Dyella sp. LX-66]|uniref:Tn3 family transposase n=1 Tax=unclassified Dyella TaxID=2634549 RepID=UPI001BE0CC00|nr:MULTISPECIES: Tn3 family transposase [unclassified Dyella]MBT2118911.1 Tn3 family transposase [Dyella sp. LX-1]MBT2140095.1 Tn3 family transposase [Dyella sp. LX-66]
MTAIKDTAYPRFKSDPSAKDLEEAYTPTPDEVAFTASIADQPRIRLAVMLHLKAYQKMGRFITLDEMPERIIRHIADAMGYRRILRLDDLSAYDASRRKREHIKALRIYLGVRPLGEPGRRWLEGVAHDAARTRHYLADIIAVLLEELARHRHELPAFRLLDEMAARAREQVHQDYFERIDRSLSPEARTMISSLLIVPAGSSVSIWQTLKREPRRPGNKEVRSFLAHVAHLRELAELLPPLDIPVPKLKHFRDMAKALDLSELTELLPAKRNALAVIYVRAQYARTLDDTADLFIRLIQALENTALRSLLAYQQEHQKRTDRLVGQLRDILHAYQTIGTDTQRIGAIGDVVGEDISVLLAECEEHMAYADQHYIPFLPKPYASQRALLLNCVQIMGLRSTSNDPMTERLLLALEQCRHQRREIIETEAVGLDAKSDFHWLSQPWRREIFPKAWGADRAGCMQRRFFELAVLFQIKDELKSGDVFIPGGERFDDYREELIDQEAFHKELAEYGEIAGLETEPGAFVSGLRESLRKKFKDVNARFPDNAYAEIVDGRLTLRKLARRPITRELALLDAKLIERLAPTSIIDVLWDVTHWANLERHFKTVAGTDGRLDDLRYRIVTTLFCYGCNLGPTQTARSVRGLSRKQAGWLNLKYVTDETLERCTTDIINLFNRYDLPSYWGSGRSASADGTKWTLFEDNLISEKHIRYGGYGGIGYYHISDKYIALFSRFIACGVHEAVYILDVLANRSDIQPNTLHGDTQSQSFPVFALSHLLGIKLMPRIRNIRDLTLSRPDPEFNYPHLQSLTGGKNDFIDWELIQTHFHDMLRVAVSIKTGKITASTILRRLGTASRKNKLYFAFRELGKVIRTLFLLDYIDDPEVRQIIHAATNKSEEWNNFAKWAFFGGQGIIAENLRLEQQKVVSYNHLVANMVILYNVEHMSRAILELQEEGMTITPEMLAGLAPYRMAHINRFGDYTLDPERLVPPHDAARRVLHRAEASDRTEASPPESGSE